MNESILKCYCFRRGEEDHLVTIGKDSTTNEFTAASVSIAIAAQLRWLDGNTDHESLPLIALYERGTRIRIIGNLSHVIRQGKSTLLAECDFRVFAFGALPDKKSDCPCQHSLDTAGNVPLSSDGALEEIMKNGLGIGRLEVASCLPQSSATAEVDSDGDPSSYRVPTVADESYEDDDSTETEGDNPPSVSDELIVLFPSPSPIPTKIEEAPLSGSLHAPEEGTNLGATVKSSECTASTINEEMNSETSNFDGSQQEKSSEGDLAESSSDGVRDDETGCETQSGALFSWNRYTKACRSSMFSLLDSTHAIPGRPCTRPKCPINCGISHGYQTIMNWVYSYDESTFFASVEYSTIFDRRMNWMWVDACALVMTGQKVILHVERARASGPPLELQGYIVDDPTCSDGLACVQFHLLEKDRLKNVRNRLLSKLVSLSRTDLLLLCALVGVSQLNYGNISDDEGKEIIAKQVLRDGGPYAVIEKAISLLPDAMQ